MRTLLLLSVVTSPVVYWASPVVRPHRELVVATATWCRPCQAVHRALADEDRVRFLDYDADQGEVRAVFGRMPKTCPAFALVEDGRTVQTWSVPLGLSWDETRWRGWARQVLEDGT